MKMQTFLVCFCTAWHRNTAFASERWKTQAHGMKSINRRSAVSIKKERRIGCALEGGYDGKLEKTFYGEARKEKYSF